MKVKKSDKYLAMQCYRYAPEQFKAFRITGFSGGNKNIPIYEKIKLSYDETTRCGNAMICNGRDAALAELKRILRTRESNNKQLYTIGFMSNGGKDFAFMRGLCFERGNLKNAYSAYQELKKCLAEQNWRIKQSTSVKLDGRYKPIPESVSESYLEINPNKPCFVRLVQHKAA